MTEDGLEYQAMDILKFCILFMPRTRPAKFKVITVQIIKLSSMHMMNTGHNKAAAVVATLI